MTSSPILVAAGAILQFLPWLVFGLHAGAIADRFDRRRLVMVANGARAVVLLALCAFLVTGTANIWIVLASAFLRHRGGVRRHRRPPLLPMLLKPVDLGLGNARLQAGFLVANQFAGPPLGAFLFAAATAVAVPARGGVREPGGRADLPHRRTPVPPRDTGTPRPLRRSRPAKVHTDIAEGLRWLWRNLRCGCWCSSSCCST
jgi:MFS family permease